MPSINTHFAMSYPILPAEVYMIALPRCSRSIFGIALFDASNVVRGSGGYFHKVQSTEDLISPLVILVWVIFLILYSIKC